MAALGKTLRLAMLAVLCGALAACSAVYRNHGYIPPQEALDEIVVGVDTRESLAETLGRPSSTGLLEDSGWYYVQSRWRHFAYRAPEEIERQVVAISFDANGTVTNVERFGLQDGEVVALSRRITETSIRNASLLRQLFQNFGRIQAADLLR
jgi:outer membrane protein assembly factor BamE (lipoprotein component of BamABCDE complex)